MDAPVIELVDVCKRYSLESRPLSRLWQQLTGQLDRGPVHQALQHVNLSLRRGEVLGLVGRNGAGKSTLLQIVCGVLRASSGQCRVQGRVAALLELGAGFSPDLTGRENVRLNGPLMGLTAAQIEARLPAIVSFSGIGDFADQPVRTYSSGMFMRLAFAMATSVDPDILVIDEALSVGDGSFARKSFERIMELKERGATLLFCSHSMFQIEQLCTRALWLHDGRVMFDGPPHQAVVAYDTWMSQAEGEAKGRAPKADSMRTAAAEVLDVQLRSGAVGAVHRSGVDSLRVRVRVRSDPAIPCPNLGVVLHAADGQVITSAGNWLDATVLDRDAQGVIDTVLSFPALPLLKGRYTVSVYVLCERAINLYAAAQHAAAFEVEQQGAQQGLVSLPHRWEPGRDT